jgi:DNA polymerase elongation subunit (family B)
VRREIIIKLILEKGILKVALNLLLNEREEKKRRRQKGKTNFPLSVLRKAFATFQVLQITQETSKK